MLCIVQNSEGSTAAIGRLQVLFLFCCFGKNLTDACMNCYQAPVQEFVRSRLLHGAAATQPDIEAALVSVMDNMFSEIVSWIS